MAVIATIRLTIGNIRTTASFVIIFSCASEVFSVEYPYITSDFLYKFYFYSNSSECEASAPAFLFFFCRTIYCSYRSSSIPGLLRQHNMQKNATYRKIHTSAQNVMDCIRFIMQ